MDRAYEWLAEVPQQLHHDIKKVQTVNSDSSNVCRQNMPCRFFQWVDREWSDQIFQHRLQEARKNDWKGECKEKSSGLAEVDGPLDPHQARKKPDLEKMEASHSVKVIPVPSLPGEKLQEELEKYMRAAMDGPAEEVEGTQRVAAEVVPAIRRDQTHHIRTVACLF